jgi:hypothetical protein
VKCSCFKYYTSKIPWKVQCFSLLYDTFSVTRLYSIDDRVIIELWWTGKDLAGSGHDLTLKYYPSIHLEGLRKTTRNRNQDSRSTGPRFEHRTYRIRSRSVNHSTATFSHETYKKTTPSWQFYHKYCTPTKHMMSVIADCSLSNWFLVYSVPGHTTSFCLLKITIQNFVTHFKTQVTNLT